MPGLNGSGPMGAGPMTGGGRGYCNPAGSGGYARPLYGQGRGFRGGYGSGPGFGQGRGYGGWRGAYPAATNASYTVQPEDELNNLKNQANFIKNELDAINKRIVELQSTSSG